MCFPALTSNVCLMAERDTAPRRLPPTTAGSLRLYSKSSKAVTQGELWKFCGDGPDGTTLPLGLRHKRLGESGIRDKGQRCCTAALLGRTTLKMQR